MSFKGQVENHAHPVRQNAQLIAFNDDFAKETQCQAKGTDKQRSGNP